MTLTTLPFPEGFDRLAPLRLLRELCIAKIREITTMINELEKTILFLVLDHRPPRRNLAEYKRMRNALCERLKSLKSRHGLARTARQKLRRLHIRIKRSIVERRPRSYLSLLDRYESIVATLA